MRNRLSVVVLCTVLIGVFMATCLYGASKEDSQKTWFKQDRAPKYMIPFERDVMGHKPNYGEPSSIPLGSVKSKAAGTIAGYTTYDYQHNGSMGRQLVTDNELGIVQFVWMAQDDKTIPGARGIKWNAYIVSEDGYAATIGGSWITWEYSGYTSITTFPGFAGPTGAVAAHTKVGGDDYYDSWLYMDYLPAENIFSDFYVMSPDPGADWYMDNIECIWPIVDHHRGGTGPTETVVYMLTHVFEGSEDIILYRSFGIDTVVTAGDTSFLPDNWDNGTYIETVTDLSYIVRADPNSDKVAIVYTDDRRGEEEGSGSQTDLDVWYMLSTDQGATWDRTDRTDEGVLFSQAGRYCVSQYSYEVPEVEDSLWRAYSDLSAVWTPDGNLHIVWPARELLDKDTYENYKARLVHWSTDIPNARIIAEARHTMKNATDIICDAGAWNMYIAKPSVSWCDNRMYALWTQFGSRGRLNDCSSAGYANGDLMLAVSADNGLTWDNPTNLTDSYTPNCTDSTCDSDHWSSMALYGAVYEDPDPDILDILYINDKSAGGIPQGEGIWCVSPVMHLRTPCRVINDAPKIAFGINAYVDPVHTAPGQPLESDMVVMNIGNATLTGNLTIGYVTSSGWIGFNGSNQTAPLSIQAGENNTQIVPLTLNVGGMLTTNPSGWDAYIIAQTDAASSPDTIQVHLTVASDFDMPENATLNTTNKALRVYNTARVGGNNDGETLGFPRSVDCDTIDQNPNTDIWCYDASPALSWLEGGSKREYATVWSQLFTEERTWRPQTGLTLDESNPDYNMASFTVCSSDSIFGCDVRYWAPKDGNDFVIGKFNFYLWQHSPVDTIQNVNVGYFMDWDIPADTAVDNGSGYAEITIGDVTLNTLYQYGAEYHVDNSEAPCNIDERDRFGGIVYLNGNLKNGWSAENGAVQQGSFVIRGWVYDRMVVLDPMYTLHEDPSSRDSLIDLHTGVTFETTDMIRGEHYDYVFALVTSMTGIEDYLAQCEAAYNWATDMKLMCCDKAGDANNDGSVNVGDQVYLLNYIFKPGQCATNPPIGCPPFCQAEGDANSDRSVNVGDAVYLGNYIFRPAVSPVPRCGPVK